LNNGEGLLSIGGEPLDVPIVGAPLAGGPTTPALAAAVSEAGGFGSLAAGYKRASDVEADISGLHALTSKPFGVNLFYPVREEVDEAALAAYVERLQSEAERWGVQPGEPRWTDDDWEAKLDLVARERPAVVSFTFGCPQRDVVEWLRSRGCQVWCTVTSVAEAQQAEAVTVDALVIQGAEAGGHQGSFHDRSDEPLSVLALLQLIRSKTNKPLIAAGGIATGAAVAAALAAGASAAQIGTALMLTGEAATSAPHRAALKGHRPTKLTRAFTGRRARGIVNRFMLEHDEDAPIGYPEIHTVTAPIRAAARDRGDQEAINLWAGQTYPLAREESAGELVERWASDLARVLR
jgi:nitronate monooxygenase